jgi:hypothetical protein
MVEVIVSSKLSVEAMELSPGAEPEILPQPPRCEVAGAVRPAAKPGTATTVGEVALAEVAHRRVASHACRGGVRCPDEFRVRYPQVDGP